MKKYILQTKEKGYSCCQLISLLNARIYYGNPYLTTLDDYRWEEMVDKYLCRNGSCLGSRSEMLKEVGLSGELIDRDEIPNKLPASMTSFTAVGFHNSLVVSVDGDEWTIVNYDGYKGDVITVVNKNDINFLKTGHSNDEHYFLSEIKGD